MEEKNQSEIATADKEQSKFVIKKEMAHECVAIGYPEVKKIQLPNLDNHHW